MQAPRALAPPLGTKSMRSSSGASSFKCGYFEKKLKFFVILKLFLKMWDILKKIAKFSKRYIFLMPTKFVKITYISNDIS